KTLTNAAYIHFDRYRQVYAGPIGRGVRDTGEALGRGPRVRGTWLEGRAETVRLLLGLAGGHACLRAASETRGWRCAPRFAGGLDAIGRRRCLRCMGRGR